MTPSKRKHGLVVAWLRLAGRLDSDWSDASERAMAGCFAALSVHDFVAAARRVRLVGLGA